MTSTVSGQRGLSRPYLGIILALASMILLASSALAALAGDSAAGKRLHEANCTGCHDSGVYTRKARTVHSLDALKQQLDSCGHATKKEFSVAEKQNIIKYLNDQYYRFP